MGPGTNTDKDEMPGWGVALIVVGTVVVLAAVVLGGVWAFWGRMTSRSPDGAHSSYEEMPEEGYQEPAAAAGGGINYGGENGAPQESEGRSSEVLLQSAVINYDEECSNRVNSSSFV